MESLYFTPFYICSSVTDFEPWSALLLVICLVKFNFVTDVTYLRMEWNWIELMNEWINEW